MNHRYHKFNNTIFIAIICSCLCFFNHQQLWGAATDKIKVFFNHPVNTTVATGPYAVYLNNSLADTLAAYISRAKYTIDVAQYEYVQSSSYAAIYAAIDSAYARGVRIRWIYDGSASNTGLSLLDSGIHTLASPTTSAYGIMHNKFVVIDATSSDTSDAVVWTGSADWNITQFDDDYNNAIVVQDSSLAAAYTVEFNQMWGGAGAAPDMANSKFGPYKSDVTQHVFSIGGATVECYFSPSDGTNAKIVRVLNGAVSQLFFGVYTFTESADATAIVNRSDSGVYAAGIVDQYSVPYSAYPILNAGLGNMLELYANNNYIYHNKFAITDVCGPAADPQVITGSHNWSVSADTKNDENTLIIHDATIANLYYQSFYQNFSDLGGTLSPCLLTSTNDIKKDEGVGVYPNPASQSLVISNWSLGGEETAEIYNVLGEKLYHKNCQLSTVNCQLRIDVSSFSNGVYLLKVQSAEGIVTKRFEVLHK